MPIEVVTGSLTALTSGGVPNGSVIIPPDAISQFTTIGVLDQVAAIMLVLGFLLGVVIVLFAYRIREEHRKLHEMKKINLAGSDKE
jgi:hypothetical protein